MYKECGGIDYRADGEREVKEQKPKTNSRIYVLKRRKDYWTSRLNVRRFINWLVGAILRLLEGPTNMSISKKSQRIGHNMVPQYRLWATNWKHCERIMDLS